MEFFCRTLTEAEDSFLSSRLPAYIDDRDKSLSGWGAEDTRGELRSNHKGEKMATTIKSVAIITNQGANQYFVGREYNGLLLAEIKDKSVEFPDSITTIYMGFTLCGELVFEAINVPLEVQYGPA